jgi:uncharacterized protein YdhG (YjbR/CyaY superfamily)
MAAAAKNTKSKSVAGFSDAERAAMKERAEELKLEGRGGKKKAEEAEACLAKIAEMSQPDRGIAERIHAIVAAVAPELDPKTWYGMPAYARDGKVVCFFKPAEKFESRYATFGFEDPANIDEGTMWPTSFGLTDLTEGDSRKIEALVKQAVS